LLTRTECGEYRLQGITNSTIQSLQHISAAGELRKQQTCISCHARFADQAPQGHDSCCMTAPHRGNEEQHDSNCRVLMASGLRICMYMYMRSALHTTVTADAG
jgi:hypothetical protein